jgi:glutathione S-transferase
MASTYQNDAIASNLMGECICIDTDAKMIQSTVPTTQESMEALTLVSFDLRPCVQRAAIVLTEKNIPFERIDVDLSNKPDWFKAISPLGKVPLLKVGEEVLFESAVIVEYIEETREPALHPSNPLVRARHRAWMEFGSSILADIWIVETTSDRHAFNNKLQALKDKVVRLEAPFGVGLYFVDAHFSIFDAVFAPVFRYFDVFDTIADLGVLDGLPKVQAWRKALAMRLSVRTAVVADYPDRLRAFLRRHNGVIAEGL